MGELRNPPILRERRRLLRRNSTKPEQLLWQKLRNSATGFKFRRQYGISRYIPDFYCAELHLVIEVDGSYHYEPLQQELDAVREDDLRRLGCTILRYTAAEVMRNLDGVVEDIQRRCEGMRTTLTRPLPARERH